MIRRVIRMVLLAIVVVALVLGGRFGGFTLFAGTVALVGSLLLESPIVEPLPPRPEERELVLDVDTLKTAVFGALAHLDRGELSAARAMLARASLRVKQRAIARYRHSQRLADAPLGPLETPLRLWQENDQ